MSKKRAFVTGLGIVSPLGLGVSKNWDAALKGHCAIVSIQDLYPESPIYAAGVINQSDRDTISKTFPIEAKNEGEARTLFALWAAQEALTDAMLKDTSGLKVGVSFASGLGINRLEDIVLGYKDNSFDYGHYLKRFTEIHRESIMRNNSHRPAALIARRFGLRGGNITSTSACASATQAIGIALRTVQRGEADIMLAGGADSMINPIGLVFFVLLGAASTNRDANCCRPFDRRRSGLVMGEGAAFLVIESEDSVQRKDAKVYCEIAGYGTSMDAYQVTAPEPEGTGAYYSMKRAIEDAGISTTEIDYINAHGTSTKLNDLAETIAIKRLFAEHAHSLKINSTKSLIGHLLAASGAPEAVFTVLSVRDDIVHPTINLTQPDPRCDLNYTANRAIKTPIRAALSNSFGFGGQNATVVFRKAKEDLCV
jgi:3-oxoacyl-[acyl-carrier-protein] synthase II